MSKRSKRPAREARDVHDGVYLTTGEITHEFTHDDSIPTECGFSEDGRELVVHSTKSWHFWPLNLMEEAQKLKRRELTPEERATYGIPLR